MALCLWSPAYEFCSVALSVAMLLNIVHVLYFYKNARNLKQ
jgi:hypothetical protein